MLEELLLTMSWTYFHYLGVFMFWNSTYGTDHPSLSSMSQPCHHQKVILQSISGLPSRHVAFVMPCLLKDISSYYMCIGCGRLEYKGKNLVDSRSFSKACRCVYLLKIKQNYNNLNFRS